MRPAPPVNDEIDLATRPAHGGHFPPEATHHHLAVGLQAGPGPIFERAGEAARLQGQQVDQLVANRQKDVLRGGAGRHQLGDCVDAGDVGA